jgi:predicted RNase H-like HicB family nuclease
MICNLSTLNISNSAILLGMELIFEVREAEEGGYFARALGHSIFTQGETWEELRANVLEAASLHFEDSSERPKLVQLHYVKDELIPLEAA